MVCVADRWVAALSTDLILTLNAMPPYGRLMASLQLRLLVPCPKLKTVMVTVSVSIAKPSTSPSRQGSSPNPMTVSLHRSSVSYFSSFIPGKDRTSSRESGWGWTSELKEKQR